MKRLVLRPPSRIISGNRSPLLALGLLAAFLAPACRDGGRPADPPAAAQGPATTSRAAPGTPEQEDERPVILFVGTSLTAGHGLDISEAYPARTQERLDEAGLGYRVVNAGVSGETSAGALRRMDWLLRQPIAVLVLETGANDGLRGQDPEATRANIQALFDRVRQQEPPPRLVLVAMEALPNYGEDYRQRFRDIYPAVAEVNEAALIPFFLEGVAGDPALNQSDGIHPTAEGHERVADTVWKTLEPLLEGPPSVVP